MTNIIQHYWTLLNVTILLKISVRSSHLKHSQLKRNLIVARSIENDRDIKISCWAIIFPRNLQFEQRCLCVFFFTFYTVWFSLRIFFHSRQNNVIIMGRMNNTIGRSICRQAFRESFSAFQFLAFLTISQYQIIFQS